MQEALSLASEALRHSRAEREALSPLVEAARLEGWRLAWAQAYQAELEERGWHLVAQEVYQASPDSAGQGGPWGWEALAVWSSEVLVCQQPERCKQTDGTTPVLRRTLQRWMQAVGPKPSCSSSALRSTSRKRYRDSPVPSQVEFP